MEKEKFAAMGLPDELLEKVSGGYTLEGGEGNDEEGWAWLIYHLSPGESCRDNVFMPFYYGNGMDPKGLVSKASSALDAKDRIRSARTLKVKLGDPKDGGWICVLDVEY